MQKPNFQQIKASAHTLSPKKCMRLGSLMQIQNMIG